PPLPSRTARLARAARLAAHLGRILIGARPRTVALDGPGVIVGLRRHRALERLLGAPDRHLVEMRLAEQAACLVRGAVARPALVVLALSAARIRALELDLARQRIVGDGELGLAQPLDLVADTRGALEIEVG